MEPGLVGVGGRVGEHPTGALDVHVPRCSGFGSRGNPSTRSPMMFAGSRWCRRRSTTRREHHRLREPTASAPSPPASIPAGPRTSVAKAAAASRSARLRELRRRSRRHGLHHAWASARARRAFHDSRLRVGVQLREALADGRVVGTAVLRELEHLGEREHRASYRRAARRRRVAGPPTEHAALRARASGSRRARRRRRCRCARQQRRLRHRPSVALAADEVAGLAHRLVEEDLVEDRLARSSPAAAGCRRPAGRGEREPRDAGVLGHVEVGAGEEHARSRPRMAMLLHTFWPVTTHRSPSRTAAVVSPARSEPAPGSLNSWHHPTCPRGSAARAGRSGRRRRGRGSSAPP